MGHCLIHLQGFVRGLTRFSVEPGFSGSFIEEVRNSFTNSEDMAGPTSISTSTSTSTSTSNSTSTTALNEDDSTVSTDSKYVKLPSDSIAVLRYSPSPYGDFRRSMKEMVEARLQYQSTVDWDFLEELLFCYLRLNENKSHKFIIRAFVDLVVILRQNSNKIPARSRHDFRVARERKRKMKHVT
ncbi:hypothetical protein Patl1_34126 [Pistacia atlantica]|uniref:Uncharacterized protein n=1 Tax=Pistacia atlantica TaxID=434234 RepID=A0ACC0ZW19_9ROSI|nr:hypothetical protein Patl1_34126 [Pistacia atlantica]